MATWRHNFKNTVQRLTRNISELSPRTVGPNILIVGLKLITGHAYLQCGVRMLSSYAATF